MRQIGRYPKNLGRWSSYLPHLLMFAVAIYAPVAFAANTVRVIVSGISHLEGSLRATLDGSEGAFLNNLPTTQKSEQEVNAQEMELVFRDVPPGKYAIKIIHDQNNDQKLNLNFLGIPAEKYGISNNVKGKFGLPEFKDASFEVGPEDLVLSITVSRHKFY